MWLCSSGQSPSLISPSQIFIWSNSQVFFEADSGPISKASNNRRASATAASNTMDYQLQVVDAHSDDGGGLPRAAERDLTIIFEYFAARGTGRAMGMSTKGVIMMESRNLMRLFRDAGMIHRPGRGPLTSARIDLIFTQVISDHARRHADNSVHDAKHAKIGRDLPGLRGKGVQKKKKVVPRKIEFAQFMEVLERCAGIMRRPFMSLVEEIVNSRGGHSAAHHMLGDSPASKGTPYTRRMSAAGKSLLAQHLVGKVGQVAIVVLERERRYM